MKRIIREYAPPILFALLIAILTTTMIRPTMIREYSMYPTITPYSYIIVNKVSYLFGVPAPNDIIVFKANMSTGRGEGKRLLKRVIGVEGDVIEIKNGAVYRNGKKLIEDYTANPTMTDVMEPFTVSKDHVFVMGDNREVSLDSRDSSVGEVAFEDILGRADFRLFPLDRIGAI
ncbi:signal peptidase I [Bacillota bacterium]